MWYQTRISGNGDRSQKLNFNIPLNMELSEMSTLNQYMYFRILRATGSSDRRSLGRSLKCK